MLVSKDAFTLPYPLLVVCPVQIALLVNMSVHCGWARESTVSHVHFHGGAFSEELLTRQVRSRWMALLETSGKIGILNHCEFPRSQ